MLTQRPFDLLSNDNTLFATEQCNNHCLMCCQPPRRVDDIDALFAQNLERIHTAPATLPVIGITGGEPTLLGDRLIDLVREIRSCLPVTDIHILTNGRRLSDIDYAVRLICAGEDRLILGIPLHSDYEGDHDLIAGAKGAYVQTMLGLYNVAMAGGLIELRIVMNRLNHMRFLPMAEFIHKNLSFVAWTAFMSMERTGFADQLARRIWIEPLQYVASLTSAVEFLDSWHHEVAIYNIPLCLLPPRLHPFARQSISTWKNHYLALCDRCRLKSHCCGLFTTSTKTYEGLNPYTQEFV